MSFRQSDKGATRNLINNVQLNLCDPCETFAFLAVKKQKQFIMKQIYTHKMKQLLFIIVVLTGTLSYSQDITFTFANAEITNDGANDFYEADIMIAATSDFTVGSGLLYFNYNNAAFGSNISDGGTVEVTYPSPDYICGDVDAVVGGVVAVYGPFVQNDNTASRFAFSFQQTFGSGAMAGNNVTSTPAKLFHLKIQYIDSAIDPMMSFEGNPPFDDQFFTACGPVAVGLTPANCSGEPGTQLLNDTFDSSASTPVPLSVESVVFQNLKIYPNPVSDVINITATQTIEKVEIYDLLGKLVLETSTTNQIKVSQLTNGIYLFKIFSDGKNTTKKIVKK